LIESDELRRGIIGAYEISEAMVYAAAQNNRLLFECVEIEAEMNRREDEFQRERMERKLAALRESAKEMRTIFDQTVIKVTAVMADLDGSIDRQR